MKRSRAAAADSPAGPLSVNLPASARRGLAREAKRRGLPLSTTVRALALERMTELQEAAELTAAEAWQRAQAWATWDRIRAGDRREVTRADLGAFLKRPSRSRRK